MERETESGGQGQAKIQYASEEIRQRTHTYIHLIVIKACWQHGLLLLFHVIHPYHPSLLLDPRDGIQFSHRVGEFKFLLVGHHWCLWALVHRRTSLMSSFIILKKCPAWNTSWSIEDKEISWHFFDYAVPCINKMQ